MPKIGRPRNVSAEEREEIWRLYFGEGHSQERVGELIGRDKRTIRRAMAHPDAKKAKEDIQAALRDGARRKLTAMAERAAESWGKQLELADRGERANHLPAKDLLTHVKAIDIAVPNQQTGTQILIQIGAEAQPKLVGGHTIEGEGLVIEGTE